MAVTGTLTNARKWRWVIYMVLALGFSTYCYYDGWHNPKYQVDEEFGTRLFNQAGAVVLAVTFVVLVIGYFVKVRRTRVVVDQGGIDVNGKYKIPWSSITHVEDKHLEKGLLDIFYQTDGRERKFVLDNYKVTSFEEMLEEIDVHRPDLLALEDKGQVATEES